MILKSFIRDPVTNSIEVTWVRVVEPEEIIPASIDRVSGAAIPERRIPALEEIVRCHTYMDVQMDMLVSDLGDDAVQYADLIAEVRAAIKPPPPKTLEQQGADIKAQIAALEASQPRAIREAVLTGDKTRLAALDAEIAALRRQLPKAVG